MCVDVDNYKIINIYKPPSTRLQTSNLPVFPYPNFYACNLNSTYSDWVYNNNNAEGGCPATWANSNNLALTYDPKDTASVLWIINEIPNILLHQLMIKCTTAHEERLQSRHSFDPAARKMINELSKLSTRAAQWTDFKWDTKYSKGQSKLCLFSPRPSARPLGMDLARPVWIRLNHHCPGIGSFKSSMHKWGFASTSICECGHLTKPKPM